MHTLKIIASAVILASSLTATAQIDFTVQTADYGSEHEHNVIEGFVPQLEQLAEIQVGHAQQLETAATEFANCDQHLGTESADRKAYLDCSVMATMQARTAYRQIEQSARSSMAALAAYRDSVENQSAEFKQQLGAEAQILQLDEDELSRLIEQAKSMAVAITGFEGEELTLDQRTLLWELVDGYKHHLSLLNTHGYAVKALENAISKQGKIEMYMQRKEAEMNRIVNRSVQNQQQASEAIRVAKIFGKTATNMNDFNAITLSMDLQLPELDAILSRGPKLEEVFPMLDSNNDNSVINQRPQTKDKALELLQAIIAGGA